MGLNNLVKKTTKGWKYEGRRDESWWSYTLGCFWAPTERAPLLWGWEQTLVSDPAVKATMSSRKQDTFPRTWTDTPAHSLALLTLAGGAALSPPEIIDIINIAETCYFHTRDEQESTLMGTGQENAASLCRHLVKRLNVDKAGRGCLTFQERQRTCLSPPAHVAFRLSWCSAQQCAAL